MASSAMICAVKCVGGCANALRLYVVTGSTCTSLLVSLSIAKNAATTSHCRCCWSLLLLLMVLSVSVIDVAISIVVLDGVVFVVVVIMLFVVHLVMR